MLVRHTPCSHCCSLTAHHSLSAGHHSDGITAHHSLGHSMGWSPWTWAGLWNWGLHRLAGHSDLDTLSISSPGHSMDMDWSVELGTPWTWLQLLSTLCCSLAPLELGAPWAWGLWSLPLQGPALCYLPPGCSTTSHCHGPGSAISSLAALYGLPATRPVGRSLYLVALSLSICTLAANLSHCSAFSLLSMN